MPKTGSGRRPRTRQVRESCPRAVERIRRYLQEFFGFVAEPGVRRTNTVAGRSLCRLVIAREVSGGSRSAVGSICRILLVPIAAAVRLRAHDPTEVFFRILTDPSHAF